MPNWAGSCWYYLRYLDPADDERRWSTRSWSSTGWARAHPATSAASTCTSAVEHAVLHLLYARFWHKVLHDLGHVSSEEPFRRLVNQGYISAYAYTDERGFYVPPPRSRRRTAVLLRRRRGQPRVREDRQEPEEHGHAGRDDRAYGADTFRVYEMSTGPLDQSRRGRPRPSSARSGCCSGSGASSSTRRPARSGLGRHPRRGHPAGAAPDDRRGPRRARPRCGSTSRSRGSPS